MYILGTNEIGQTPCVRIIDGNNIISIPMDEANTDYQNYLKWVELGGVPLPADE